MQIFKRAPIYLFLAMIGLMPTEKVLAQIQVSEVALSAGIGSDIYNSSSAHGLGAVWIDYDNDGFPDLFVPNGASLPSHLYRNNGDGTFSNQDALLPAGLLGEPTGAMFADYDNDGDADIAAIVTQDEEELWIFENSGDGKFKPRRLWSTLNFDLGSAGLLASDLDRDGDIDLILPAGDNLEDFDPFPQPYHGCLWFENHGNMKFEAQRIASFGGTYAAAAGDVDSDGDTDVVLVSMANVWDDADRASIAWLENDGKQQFQLWKIDSTPTHLVTVDVAYLDGDGQSDIVAGGLHIRGPYDRIGRVTHWERIPEKESE